MNYLNIDLPKVPENIHNLRDYKDFIELITYAQKINKNVSKYAEHIVNEEFLKNKSDWKEVLSEKDFAPIKDITCRHHAVNYRNENPQFLYCKITNKFFLFEADYHAPSTGYGGDKVEYKFDIKRNMISLILISSTAGTRPRGRCEGYETIKRKIFNIDLLSKIITKIGDSNDE